MKNGIYYVQSRKNLLLVLDMNGSSKANGGNALAWSFNAGKNQRWKILFDKASGFYYLVNVNSGKVLDVSGAKAKNGANVLQWAKKSGGATNQLWKITYSKTRGYTIASALNTKFVLGLQGGKKAKEGANVQIQTSTKNTWQQWWLVALKPDVKAKKTLKDGVYTIATSANAKQLIDVEGASQKNGANVDVWKSNSGFNQKWAITRGSDNFYTIVSVSSGKALDIDGASVLVGANVLQWAQKKSGADNQKWAIQKNSDGSYTFISKLNGMALSVTGSANGKNVRTYADNGASHEKFTVKSTPIIPNGVYSISMRKSAKKVVDVPGQDMSMGTQLALWGYNAGLNQKYQVKRVSGNVYTIQAGHSGGMLADSKGKVVQAKRNSSSKAQRWKAVWKGTGIQLVNVSTGRALSVKDGVAANGAAMEAVKPSAATQQRFVFTKRDVLEPGMYIISSYAGSSVIDIEGASKSDGANALIWKSNGDNNQKFQITAVSGGYFKIESVKSGKVLDVEGASKASGANVLQWTYKKSANQLWKPELSPNGGIVFKNKNSGMVLSIAGGKDTSGANVRVEKNRNAASQRWSVTTTTRKIEDVALERALEIVKGKSSSTNYLVTVDLTNHKTIVWQRSNGSWKVVKNWTCTTGAKSSPTVTGDYTVGAKGYSFGSGYTCYYYTQFYGDYLFHSIKYYEGTFNVMDGRLGVSASAGCVRLALDNARWIYNNVPEGTKVSTYY